MSKLETILNQMSYEETAYQSKTWLPNQKKQASREWQEMRDKTLVAITNLITAHTTEALNRVREAVKPLYRDDKLDIAIHNSVIEQFRYAIDIELTNSKIVT